MNAVVKPPKTTPEELLRMPDGDDYDLVDGNLVERKTGAESSFVAINIIAILYSFCRGHKIGRIFGADASYQCFPSFPVKVRKPDVSMIKFGRLAGEKVPRGHILISPDLAVEVVSPNDLATEIDEKVDEYLKANVPLVWVVNPIQRTVIAYAADGTVKRHQVGDEIAADPVLPGFHCLVSDFFSDLDNTSS